MTTRSADAEAPVGADEAALPVEALDRALSPIRRTVAWALDGDDARMTGLRYLEANTARWLAAALSLDLPDAVREELTRVQDGLEGFDALDAAERRERLADVNGWIVRLDAQLGLPLPPMEDVPDTGDDATDAPTDAPTEATDGDTDSRTRSGSGRRGRRRKKKRRSQRGRKERGKKREREASEAPAAKPGPSPWSLAHWWALNIPSPRTWSLAQSTQPMGLAAMERKARAQAVDHRMLRSTSAAMRSQAQASPKRPAAPLPRAAERPRV